jgi:hypothetical protein
MFRAAVCTRAVRALRFVVAGSLLTLATAHAGPVAFGSRTLYVPDPNGYVPLAKAVPRFIQLGQAYLPKEIRLVEVYAAPPDAAALEQGTSATMKRYFQIQTARSADGVPVSNEDFASAATEIENGIRKAFGDASGMIKEAADKGNAEIKRQTNIDPQMQLTDTGYLGLFRTEPWGQFFTIKVKASSEGLMAKPQQMVGAGGVVLVNYQLVFLYCYANYNNEGDRQWAEKSVSEWADQVHGANPDDPSVGSHIPHSGFNFKEMLRWGVIGGVLGLLAWFFGKIFRRE